MKTKKQKIIVLLVVVLIFISAGYILFVSSSLLSDIFGGKLHFFGTTDEESGVASRNFRAFFCEDCNVILISIDTLRADHLGIYGYFRNTSPNIDSLASKGVLFKNAFAQSSNTLPSHMSIFTSLYPTTHRVLILENDALEYDNDTLDPSVMTLPEILQQYDYKTAWFADSNHLDFEKGFGRGLDEVYGGVDSADDWSGAYDWIGRNRQQKFFLFLHTSRVHDPYIVPSPFDELYDPDYQGGILGEQGEFSAQYREFKREKASDFESASEEERYRLFEEFYWQFVDLSDENDVKHLVALYDAAITCCVDPFIGELIDTLEEYGLDEKTIVIFTSDHGEAFGEHGHFLHRKLYYEELYIPLIIAMPTLNNKTIDSQVQSIDIMPTILDALDIPIPEGVQGKSLLPLMRGETKSINEYTYGYWLDVSSIRSHEWKLIKYNNGKLELYHVGNDPTEKVNVIEEYPGVARDMEKKLDEFELSTYIQ